MEDFNLDHLNTDEAEANVAASLEAAEAQAEHEFFGDADDECSGGACKI